CRCTCPSPTLLAMLALTLFFPAPAPPEVYSLSLHDALPISGHDAVEFTRLDTPFQVGRVGVLLEPRQEVFSCPRSDTRAGMRKLDRKSTRLNSSHVKISYAVFCLKKKTRPRASSTAGHK